MQTLEGKQIVLAVTGSIAAVETVRLTHALQRKGAKVQAVMSAAATGILHPDALTYATGSVAITRCSGLVEHVTWCGQDGNGDLLLIAPCTANTLAKIACAIDDTPVTTFATTALGSGIPVVVAPAMHETMYRHPVLSGHINRLSSIGVVVIPPRIEEGRAKIAGIDDIVLHVERSLLTMPLAGKRVLVTSGPCREPVDDVRVLTTRSTGSMGRAIALQAFRLGARVTVVHRDRFPCVENMYADSAMEMREAVLKFFEDSPPDFYVSAAAVSDFCPVRVGGKIPSGGVQVIQLGPLPKLIDPVMAEGRTFTIAFKLGEDAVTRAEDLLARGARMVFANKADMMGAPSGEGVMITGERSIPVAGTKEEIAGAVWDEAVRLFVQDTYQDISGL